MSKNVSDLRKRRAALLRKLQSMKPEFLRGSLIKRFKRCGKQGCKCMSGQGHGPKYYLSVSMPGKRPQMIYVPQDYVNHVTEYLNNLAKAREALEEICEINKILLKEKEDF